MQDALDAGASARGTAGALFLGFGLASLVVAVPFLWRPLPWKRLLAYSSLEHMGVLALGIGFGTPLAIAGVVIHVAGHALAKALGFYAALPLLRDDPDAAHARAARASPRPARRPRRRWASASARSAALPPSPLFVSELLILLGGVAAGETAVAVVAARRAGARLPRAAARADRGRRRRAAHAAAPRAPTAASAPIAR